MRGIKIRIVAIIGRWDVNFEGKVKRRTWSYKALGDFFVGGVERL